jgi:hypothetical protein
MTADQLVRKVSGWQCRGRIGKAIAIIEARDIERDAAKDTEIAKLKDLLRAGIVAIEPCDCNMDHSSPDADQCELCSWKAQVQALLFTVAKQ